MLLTALFAVSTTVLSSGGDDQWNNVKEVNRGATLIFVSHNHECTWGKIKTIDDWGVTVLRRGSPEIVLRKADLLRITSGAWAPGVIFGARSSWSDIVALAGKHFHPIVEIFMKIGDRRKGRLTSVSDTGVTLEVSEKTTNIGKDDISKVAYIRPKPLSDSAAYADGELGPMKPFDPQLWPKLLHLRSPESIVLFDASEPEDNSSIVCNSYVSPETPARSDETRLLISRR